MSLSHYFNYHRNLIYKYVLETFLKPLFRSRHPAKMHLFKYRCKFFHFKYVLIYGSPNSCTIWSVHRQKSTSDSSAEAMPIDLYKLWQHICVCCTILVWSILLKLSMPEFFTSLLGRKSWTLHCFKTLFKGWFKNSVPQSVCKRPLVCLFQWPRHDWVRCLLLLKCT